jgi:L-malate glycosyltransferase
MRQLKDSKQSAATRVLIIQAEMKHYRVPFFTGLQSALEDDGIELTVSYANSGSVHAARNDRAELPPPLGRRVEGRWFFHRFLYQNLWKDIFAADLVIAGPEAKYLVNPVLMILSRLGLKTVAFWGLGPNNHPDRNAFSEWVKQLFFTSIDWWFAYTASVGEYLKKRGMPADKITIVQNATDTAELRKLIDDIPDDEVLRAKQELTGSQSSSIAFYCGLIGSIKAIPLLLDAARLVKKECPDFHLVIIGNGPDREWLKSAVAEEPWIHYMGSLYGRESALFYKMANIFVITGTVGLAVVDSFAAGLPLIATEMDTHPPEISYVSNGYNGFLTRHDARSFADAILEVFSNPVLREKLQQGASESRSRYTMEAMVENYRSGIKKCLARYKGASFPELAGSGLVRRSEN